MSPSSDNGAGEDDRGAFWRLRLVLKKVRCRVPVYCFFALGLVLVAPASSIAQAPDVETQWQYVIPAGVEAQVENLFAPHKTEQAIGDGVFEKIIVSKNQVLAVVTNPDGSAGTMLIRHPLTAESGDRVFASVAVSILVVDGVAMDASIARVLVDSVKKNDLGAFPWKKVFSKKVVISEAEVDRNDRWSQAGRLELWKTYLGWVFVFLLCLFLCFTHRKRAVAWVRQNSTEFWVLIGVIIAGTSLRLWFAPEAIYKEAYNFRYAWVIASPVGQPVDFSYPSGAHLLYQLWHGATGFHPVSLVFGGNLFFGCTIPLLAALLGLRLHKSPAAPVLYGAIAAFLPHLVKYAHSEAATGPLAAMLMLALWSGSMVARGIPYALLAGLATGFVAAIRPEGFMVFPGIILWMVAFLRVDDPEDASKAAIRRGTILALVAMVVAIVLGFESLFRAWWIQASGSGVGTHDFSVLNLGKTPSMWAVLGSVLLRIFDPRWNAILSPRFTPTPVVVLGVVGLFWLLRTNRRAFLSLGALFMGFSGVYAFFVSTLSNEGEMRYHLSMAPLLVVAAGAGATVLFTRFVPQGRIHIGTIAFVAAISCCFAPYAELVLREDHPFQQEFLVLKERVLEPGLMENETAMVFVPPANEKLMDIHPLAMGPMLTNAQFTTALMPWHPSKLDEALGHVDDIPVYFYCGLYAHYLAGPDVDISQWWAGRMAELGLSMDDSASPYLKEVFSEERPFVPNHEVLDEKFSKGPMKIALYRLMK